MSSKSTTSTISTSTLCYSTLASVTAACGRKKKRAIVEVLGFSDNIEDEETYEHITSGMDDAAPSSER